MKKKLAEEIQLFLLKKNYLVKALHYCFDILARKGTQVLLVKVLHDINAMNEQAALEMEKIASFFSASPMIIADKSSSWLLDNVVYSSFGINVLNFSTFKNCIDNKFPFVKASKSGLVVSVNSSSLKSLMEKENVSPGALSKKVGVSNRAILKYEKGSPISIQKARRLYSIFGKEVFNPINIFSPYEKPEIEAKLYATKKFGQLGFNASDVHKAPFDVIAKKEKELVLTKVGDKLDKNLDVVSKLLEADDLIIFSKKKPKKIPALTKEEFLEFKKAKELIKFLKEFD